jgi:drug/metabolite transporter (DMT)-like permease
VIALNTPKRKAFLYMHLSILLWGLTGVLGRGIELQTGLLVWYRMIITVVSMLVFILFTGQSIRINRPDLFRLFGIGTLLMIHWLFFYGAIKYSNVSIALTMLASQGLFTAILEPIVRRKKFRLDEMIFSITAIIGIYLVFNVEEIYTTGMILGLLAAFMGAFFNILNKDMVGRHSPIIVSFYEIAAGLAVLSLFLPFYIHYAQPVKLLPSRLDWVLLLVLGVLCTHVTILLSLEALKHLSVFTLNLSLNLEPIYTIALAFLIFHENKQLHAGFFIGAGIIMLSVVLEGYFSLRKTGTSVREKPNANPPNLPEGRL